MRLNKYGTIHFKVSLPKRVSDLDAIFHNGLPIRLCEGSTAFPTRLRAGHRRGNRLGP
jgi:hypothetical protein